MFSTRRNRLGGLFAIALASAFVPPGAGFAQVTKPGTAPPASKAKAAEAPKAKEPVDLNSATAEELMTLPGIGEAFARKIVENRPHKAVADLAQSGIPSTTVDKLGPMVVVRPLPAPVDVNEDPAEKLETLPGVGPAISREIIAGRPYARYDDLAKLKGFGPKKLDDLRGRLKFGKLEPAKAKVTRPAADPPKAKAAPGAKVDLNKASKDELDVLPGIGPARAQAIIEARPFSKIEDVMKVKGIKDVEFAKIKDLITVK